jgi:hypothetical protein
MSALNMDKVELTLGCDNLGSKEKSLIGKK